ncbi:MAG TPA: hypothetical protein VL400_26550, partial [Polyangiaceae bacterium]|nr:hypothetical protein [Polyangiaceae bacterium]
MRFEICLDRQRTGAARGGGRGGLAQELDEIALDQARVLELVDEQRAHAASKLSEGGGVIAQRVAREPQDVAEAEDPAPRALGLEPRRDLIDEREDRLLARLEDLGLGERRAEGARPIGVALGRDALAKGEERPFVGVELGGLARAEEAFERGLRRLGRREESAARG